MGRVRKYAESWIGTEDPFIWGEALQRGAEPGPNPAANSGGDERRFEFAKRFMEKSSKESIIGCTYEWAADE